MQRSQRQDIQNWMTRLADGDRAAFDPAFQALWPVVLSFATRALGGDPDSQDVAQTALMKVFAHATRFDRERDALSWVLGIVAYECKTLRKRRARRGEVAEQALTHAATDEDPEHAALNRDLEAAAIAVLGTLSLSDIDTLHTMMSEGPRAVDAATFRKRMQRAVARLRTAWSSRHGTD